MKKFNKNVKVGTKVKIYGVWHTVKSVHPTQQWVQVDGLAGSFQKAHIEQYTNK